jgi:uncharacterized protein (DUF433 family)
MSGLKTDQKIFMLHSEMLLEQIVINAKVMAGKPVIKGTRLAVQQILGLLAQNMTTTEILDEYPKPTEEDIMGCIMFAMEAQKNIKLAR